MQTGHRGIPTWWHPGARSGCARKAEGKSINDCAEAKPSPPFQLLVLSGGNFQYSVSSGTEAVSGVAEDNPSQVTWLASALQELLSVHL